MAVPDQQIPVCLPTRVSNSLLYSSGEGYKSEKRIFVIYIRFLWFLMTNPFVDSTPEIFILFAFCKIDPLHLILVSKSYSVML